MRAMIASIWRIPVRRVPDVALYLLCLGSAFLLRALLGTPTVTPDGELYLRIAENLIRYGCYSDSHPSTGDCTPTWANQPPGYPWFLAALKALTPATPSLIVLAQALAYAIAVTYCVYTVNHAMRTSRRSLVALGLLLSVSPLTLSWSQWVLTETVAAAATLWVAAECLRSITSAQFRTRQLSAALACALLVRWDLVWLVVPVALVAWCLRSCAGIIRHVAFVLGLTILPVILFSVRATAVGLPPLPRYMDVPPDEIPPGILRFWAATAIKQTAASTFLWKVWERHYVGIDRSFDHAAFVTVAPEQLRTLLHELARLPQDAPVPKEIDDAFARVTDQLAGRSTPDYWIEVAGRRALSLWAAQDTITLSGWFRDHEGYLQPYRLALLAVVWIAPFAFQTGSALRVFSAGVLLFVLGRTAMLIWLTAVEMRYLTPFFPAMELITWLVLLRPQGKVTADVSVIIPVYNKARYLPDCLDSVLTQSLSSIEVICVDDASTDGSYAVINRFASIDPRIRVVRHRRNRGVAAARNTGLSIARGDFVQFTDADDLLTKDALRLLVERARADQVDVVRGGVVRFYTDRPDMQEAPELPLSFSRIRPLDHPTFWVPWWHTTYLFSRQFLRSNRIRYPDLSDGEDPVFLAQVLTRVRALSTVSDVTYRYRLHASSQERRSSYRHLRDYLIHAEMIRKLFIRFQSKAWYSGLAPFLRPQIELLTKTAEVTDVERQWAVAETARIFEGEHSGEQCGPRRVLYMYNVCGLGGVETSIINKAQALRPLGIEVRALFQEVWGTWRRFDTSRPGFVVEANDDARQQLIRDWDPDAIVVVDSPWLVDTAGLAGLSCPILFESHVSERSALDWRVRPAVMDVRISEVLVPSHFNRDLVRQLAGERRRVHVIPNNIDQERFCSDASLDGLAALQLPANSPLLLFVGRLEPAKNAMEFVDILAEVCAQGEAVHGVLVGAGVDTTEYADSVRAAASRLGLRASLIERIDHQEMPRLYRAVAVSGGCLLSTSRHESQPMVILEAMACGCPVVSSDVGGVREILDDGRTGCLYTLGDVGGGSRTVLRVIRDRVRTREIVEAALLEVRKTHNPSNTATAYLAALNEAITLTRDMSGARRVWRDAQEVSTGGVDDTVSFRLQQLFLESRSEDVRRFVAPYCDLISGVRLGFEPTATVALEWRLKRKLYDADAYALTIEFTGPSRWLSLEADLAWDEILGLERFDFEVQARASRELSCTVTLRLPKSGGGFSDFRMCDLIIAKGSSSGRGGGWFRWPEFDELGGRQHEGAPLLVFFFSADTDVTLELVDIRAQLKAVSSDEPGPRP
jgi:glycosyltransferase involved in cell wall biosynthesis